eukprot:2725159-Pleurochrysis_carterae.AAC.3
MDGATVARRFGVDARLVLGARRARLLRLGDLHVGLGAPGGPRGSYVERVGERLGARVQPLGSVRIACTRRQFGVARFEHLLAAARQWPGAD